MEIGNYGSFFAFLQPPIKTPKNQNFEKMKKNCWRYHFTHVHQKPQSQFLRSRVRQTEFFVILGHFFPFSPSNNQQNQNFEKMKKASGDVIILHMCQWRTQSFFGHAGTCDGTRKTLMKV